jgi:DNA-binding response OmpR family regulator
MAVEMVSKTPYHFIFMDIIMPEMDGFQVSAFVCVSVVAKVSNSVSVNLS